MFKHTKAFSGFSVDDSDKARKFYGETLGMDIRLVKGMEDMGMLELHIAGNDDQGILIYPKGGAHSPASFTILNFPVKDIDEAVDALTAKGVQFIQYDGQMKTDAKGIMRSRSPQDAPPRSLVQRPSQQCLVGVGNEINRLRTTYKAGYACRQPQTRLRRSFWQVVRPPITAESDRTMPFPAAFQRVVV